MKRETQIEILKDLIHQLDSKSHVDGGAMYKIPTNIYTCKEIAAKEKEILFRNTPQIIGLSADLPEPGSFLTVDIAGLPILATRNKQGEFQAFVNACRHRGVQVTAEERGKQSRFTCPFHGWTYGNNGNLIGINKASHYGSIDKSCNGLRKLPTEERSGLLWVHPDPDGKIDLEDKLGHELLAEFEDNFQQMGGKLVNYHKTEIEMDHNWKLAIDGMAESYHFAVLHKDTLANAMPGDSTGFTKFGRNTRFATASHGLNDVKKLPEAEWVYNDGVGFTTYCLFANVVLTFIGDLVVLWRYRPDAENPGRSTTIMSVYVPEEKAAADKAAKEAAEQAAEGVDLYKQQDTLNSLDGLIEISRSTLEEEDLYMAELQQKSYASGLVNESFFGRNEPILHNYYKWYFETLGMPPLMEKVDEYV